MISLWTFKIVYSVPQNAPFRIQSPTLSGEHLFWKWKNWKKLDHFHTRYHIYLASLTDRTFLSSLSMIAEITITATMFINHQLPEDELLEWNRPSRKELFLIWRRSVGFLEESSDVLLQLQDSVRNHGPSSRWMFQSPKRYSWSTSTWSMHFESSITNQW